MKNFTRVLVVTAALSCALLLVLAAASSAQTTTPADTLTGEKVLDRYIEATGGKEAYAKLTSQYVVLKMEFMPQLVAEMRTYKVPPDKFRTILQAPQIGTVEQGYDGTVFWEKSAVTGIRILEGAELASSIREEAAFDRFLDWKKYYSKIECVGVDTTGGSFYKVIATPLEGQPQTWFFDQKTGFVARMQIVNLAQGGALPTEITMSDYRSIGGIMAPFKLTTAAAGMNIKVNVDTILYNTAIADSLFVVPSDIQELAKKKQEEKAAPASTTPDKK